MNELPLSTYRIAVWRDDYRVALYDIRALSLVDAEVAALERVTNSLSVGESSTDEAPDDTFDA